MIRKISVFAIVFIIATGCYAQLGGRNTYEFLNLTNSARAASLGGNVIAIQDNDLNLAFHNPSLLTPEVSQQIVLNYVNYFAGVNYGYVSYAIDMKKYGTFAAGLHYINYGDFIESDETGEIIGSFTAADYSQNVMWALPLDSFFTIGATAKFIYSDFYEYYSSGLAADLGVTYHNPKLFTAALVFKNAGTQLKPYTEGHYEPLPFDIQLGISKKFAHAPIRLMLQVQHLQLLQLRYENPNDPEPTEDPITGEPLPEKKFAKAMDNIGRHMVVGIELPFDNFYVRFAYNYQRRQELKISTRGYVVGFSLGAGVKIKKFQISYGRAQYHLAGASNHFSICTNLADFKHRKKMIENNVD